jgi:hypothetical protein
MIMRPGRVTEEHLDPCLEQTDSRYVEGLLRESGPGSENASPHQQAATQTCSGDDYASQTVVRRARAIQCGWHPDHRQAYTLSNPKERVLLVAPPALKGLSATPRSTRLAPLARAVVPRTCTHTTGCHATPPATHIIPSHGHSPLPLLTRLHHAHYVSSDKFDYQSLPLSTSEPPPRKR